MSDPPEETSPGTSTGQCPVKTFRIKNFRII
jgi:hypothetical protein